MCQHIWWFIAGLSKTLSSPDGDNDNAEYWIRLILMVLLIKMILIL